MATAGREADERVDTRLSQERCRVRIRVATVRGGCQETRAARAD